MKIHHFPSPRIIVGCERVEKAFSSRSDLLWTAEKFVLSLKQELVGSYRVLCGIHQAVRFSSQNDVYDALFDMAAVLDHIVRSIHNHKPSAVDRDLKTKIFSADTKRKEAILDQIDFAAIREKKARKSLLSTLNATSSS